MQDQIGNFVMSHDSGLHLGTKSHQYGAMDLKLKLARLLEETKLPTVAEVARRADVAKTSCYRWFDPEDPALPDVKEALQVARVFGVSLDYLADDRLDQPPAPEYDHD